MCLFRLAELYCVSTKMRSMSELMQFEIGMSTSLYLPPRGTAGFERECVRGDRRVPAPPPRITARMLGLFGAISDSPRRLFFGIERDEHRRKGARVSSAPRPLETSSRRHEKIPHAARRKKTVRRAWGGAAVGDFRRAFGVRTVETTSGPALQILNAPNRPENYLRSARE